MNHDLSFSAVRDYSRHACRAGACAAGPGFSRAALPHAHLYFSWTHDFDEFRVHALGKKSVMFETRTELFEIERIDVIKIEHTMRISHRDAGDLVSRAIHGQRPIDDWAICIHRYLTPLQNGFAHIDFH